MRKTIKLVLARKVLNQALVWASCVGKICFQVEAVSLSYFDL